MEKIAKENAAKKIVKSTTFYRAKYYRMSYFNPEFFKVFFLGQKEEFGI
jgi:hypothetical protein